jgi:hypothetical protein
MNMRGSVIVAFSRDRVYEFNVPADAKSRLSAENAQQWLTEQWEAFECTPRSLVGKVLALDRVLQVAQEAGEKRFAEGGEWAQRYASAVLAALGRETVRVDIQENKVG